MIVSELSAAGFDDVRVERLSLPSPTTSHAVASAFLLGSPLRAEVEQRALTSEGCAPSVEAALTRTLGGDSFALPTAGLLITAR